MPGKELVASKAHSVQHELLKGYPETLSRAELERIQIELGETASDGAGIIPPIDNVDTGFSEQPALPPGRGELLAITAAPERQALPSAEKLALPPGAAKGVEATIVGHIDVSHNAERKAYDIANHKIEIMKKENEARFLLHPKRIARTIWGYNYTHRKALIQARQDIIKAQDVNVVDDDFNEEMRKRYGEAIFDQFFNAPDEAIDEAAGERREFFADDHEATKAVKALYAEFAREGTGDKPAMSDDEFNAAIKEIRKKHMSEPLSETATGAVELDNYLEAARAMRGRIEQGEAIEDVLEGFKLMRGESRADARTEVHKTKIDHILDKYEKSRFGESKYGSLVPSTVLAAGVSIGAFLATRAAGSGMQALAFFGGAATIGVVSGAREYRLITKQRAQMAREKFQGNDYLNDPTKRNKALSEFEYDRLSVDETLKRLDAYKEKLKSGEITKADIVAVQDELANIQALKNLSAARNIDLFDHGDSDDPNKHINDRTALAVSQSELKTLLSTILQSNKPEALSAFGLNESIPDDINTSNVINGLIESRVLTFEELKVEHINKQDELFKKYRRNESIKKGLTTAGLSLVAGAVIQEVHASLSTDKVGLVEQAWGGNDHTATNETMLAGFLPDHEANVEHINVKLPPERVAELRAEVEAKGGYLEEKHSTTYNHTSERITPEEYTRQNPGALRHFENVRLFDNNTSRIDMNELGGQLSQGPDGTVQPWDTMRSGGSISGNESIDMTNSSSNVFTIAMKQPDGTHLQKVFEYGQNVDKPWADLLYQKQDGTWGFKGDGYIAWGQSAGDTLNVAASIAGDGGPNTLVIENILPEEHFDYVLHTPAADLPTNFGLAIWAPGGRRLGVAQRPAPASGVNSSNAQPEQPTVTKDNLPVPAETAESQKITEAEGDIAKERAKASQQTIAREAGWPLLELNVEQNKDYSPELWQAASDFVNRSNELNKSVTDPLEKLRLATEMAEREGISQELKDLLAGIYSVNAAKERVDEPQEYRAPEPKPDARGYNDKAPRESENEPLTPEQIGEAIGRVDSLFDGIVKSEAIESAKIPSDTLDQAREIYRNIAKERGIVKPATLAKRSAVAVHPDVSNVDKDVRDAVLLINEELKRYR